MNNQYNRGMVVELKGYSNIADYVAPWVIGNELAKEVVGLQMCMNIKEEKAHTCLIGSPGSAKTDYLIFVKQNHRSAIKIGKDTTAAGLRGTITKQGLMGGVLRSKAGKIVGFDELDKTTKDTQHTLLEAMQNRTVTVTGQGGSGESHDAIVNIIATANPMGGNWHGEPSLGQIPFDKTLLSRFHMFVPFFDLPTDMYGELGVSFHKRGEDNGYLMRQKMLECDAIPHVTISEQQSVDIASRVGRLKDSNDMFRDYITPRYVEGARSFVRAYARFNGRADAVDEDINYIFDLYDRIISAWLRY